MQGTRFKTDDQGRPQQARQSSGAHFAKPAAGPAPKQARPAAQARQQPYPQVQSIRLPQVVAQSNRQMVTGEFKKVSASQKPSAPRQAPAPQRPVGARQAPAAPKKVSPLTSAAIPRVASEEDEGQARLRRALITGVSGSMTKIPSSSPARKVSGTNKGYSRYSNGYFDRPDAKQLTDYVAAFQTEPQAGAPAYSWQAFAVYGALSCVASVAWACVAMVGGSTPLRGASPLMFVGLVILAAVVAGGVVCAAATSAATLRRGGFEAADVWASAVGKSALVLLASLVVWIVCAAVIG